MGKKCKSVPKTPGPAWPRIGFRPAFPALFAAPPAPRHTHATCAPLLCHPTGCARVVWLSPCRRSTSGSSRHVPPELQRESGKVSPTARRPHLAAANADMSLPKPLNGHVQVRDSRHVARLQQASAQNSCAVVLHRPFTHARPRGCVAPGAFLPLSSMPSHTGVDCNCTTRWVTRSRSPFGSW